MKFLSVTLVLSFVISCRSRSSKEPLSSRLTPAKPTDVSQLVPADLAFANDLVRLLVDSGWSVEPVRPSKLNGFLRETAQAAFIMTDKGTFEVIFFASPTRVEQIQILEERTKILNYHKYIIKTPNETQRIEGSVTFFTKRDNMLIVTIDRRVDVSLKRLFATVN